MAAPEVREERAQRGSQGVLREARDAHVARGTVLNFYDDLGISTTEEGAESIRQDEADYQEEVSNYRVQLAAQQASIDSASQRLSDTYAKQSQAQSTAYSSGIDTINTSVAEGYTSLGEAYADIPTVQAAADQAWSNADNGTVRVINNAGEIEQEYVLPRSSLEAIKDKVVASEGGEYMAGIFGDNGEFLNLHAASKEVHETLGAEAQTYKDKFYASAYTSAGEGINEAKAAIGSEYTNLSTQQQAAYAEQQSVYDSNMASLNSQIETARAEIAGYQSSYNQSKALVDASVAKREGEWAAIRQNYKDKINTMSEIYMGLNIEQGGGSTNG